VKKKHQRLTLLLLAVGAVLGAVLLAMWGLRDNASYFYAPGDLAKQGRPPPDRPVRIGGMVRQLQPQPDGVSVVFVLGDNTSHTIKGRFTAPTRPKMAVMRPSPPFSFSAPARAMRAK